MDSNVWKENRIAPLEYCSFERAAKLLNCECEDLIHWNKIGAISIAFEPKNLAGDLSVREGANKQVISSQADSLIKISRIWADFFPANTSNQPI